MKLTYKLAPSILASDFSRLGEELKRIEKSGAPYVHIDVMDGDFVPNITIGIPVVRAIRSCSDSFFDVHLMVSEPVRYVERFAEAGADGITIHYEACEDVDKTLDEIIRVGVSPAISINPDTPVLDIIPYLNKVKMVLLMSVHPGYGGQKFIEETLLKASELRKYITDNNLDIDIEMDGGIKIDNVRKVLDAGVNVIVAGTGVFKGDFEANVLEFNKIFDEYEA